MQGRYMSNKNEDRAETENLASYATPGDPFSHINYHHMGKGMSCGPQVAEAEKWLKSV